MKKFILFLMIFVFNKTQAQTFQISFLGAGASATVDSVKVENLTRGTSLNLAGTDTLNLMVTIGIDNVRADEETIEVSPNPMQGQAQLSFYSKQAGKVQLAIYDISGKEVMQISEVLSQGIQKYRITGLKQCLYFIHLCGESFSCTAKLICLNAAHGEIKIEYLGSEKSEVAVNPLKSTKARVNMPYTVGEILKLTGKSGIYRTVFMITPLQSQTVTYNFVACTDTNGGNYSVIAIGTQVWMAENLNVGVRINGITEQTNNGILEKYCTFDSTRNCDMYGGLYQWNEMMQYDTTAGIRGICPIGWHLPTLSDWDTLTTFLGGVTVAGGKLKATGTIDYGTGLWFNPNSGATNETGFTALPAGYRDGFGTSLDFGFFGYWWNSSSQYSTDFASNRLMIHNTSSIGNTWTSKSQGFSVRCIQGELLNIPTVTTLSVTDVMGNSAKAGGAIIDSGGVIITAKGLCWSTSTNPTIANNTTSSFTDAMTGLTPNTGYYVRAYATNAAGTGYGNQVSFNSGLLIGDTYGGGLVFYNDGNGHGLVCAETDQNTNAEWGCYGTSIGGTSTAINTGATNTDSIVSGCTTAGIAAKICYDLVHITYDDWYLPSKDELNLIYINLRMQSLGSFATAYYWSSSEYSANRAWEQYFSNGNQFYDYKNASLYVRAVRAF